MYTQSSAMRDFNAPCMCVIGELRTPTVANSVHDASHRYHETSAKSRKPYTMRITIHDINLVSAARIASTARNATLPLSAHHAE